MEINSLTRLPLHTHFMSCSPETPRNLVILLHGYGANGEDLLSLSPYWKKALAFTLFAAPDAPHAYPYSPEGRMWFEIENLSPQAIQNNIFPILPDIEYYIRDLQEQTNIAAQHTALVGFSQGAMLALSLGLWAAQPLCQCIVSYAGLLIPAPTPPTQHPSCLLIHGKEDELIPYQASEDAKKRLAKYHVPAQLDLISPLGHGIDPQGVTSGGLFLEKHLQK